MELEDVYKQLTSIDIIEQKQIWDERGKGYYGEYLLFCELYEKVSGCCKILMNLNIPVDGDKTTEIDLIMLHETGIYVFEIKHYKGTIYGKDTDTFWTQYFRTEKNNSFKNPMEQNGYHLRALKKMFSDIPIRSVIVFTSDEGDLRVQNSNTEVDICKLSAVNSVVNNRIQCATDLFSMEDIDKLFEKLSIYSPMQKNIAIDGVEASFYEWVQPTINKLEQVKKETDSEKNRFAKLNKKLKLTKIIGIASCVAIAVLCVSILVFFVSKLKKYYNAEINEARNNFLYTVESDKQNNREVTDNIVVSNISIEIGYDKEIVFTAGLSMKDDSYNMMLTENSKYVVLLANGEIHEYNVFGSHLLYSPNANKVGITSNKYGQLAKIKFEGISKKEDILCIKLSEIEIYGEENNINHVYEHLTIELYQKSAE